MDYLPLFGELKPQVDQALPMGEEGRETYYFIQGMRIQLCNTLADQYPFEDGQKYVSLEGLHADEKTQLKLKLLDGEKQALAADIIDVEKREPIKVHLSLNGVPPQVHLARQTVWTFTAEEFLQEFSSPITNQMRDEGIDCLTRIWRPLTYAHKARIQLFTLDGQFTLPDPPLPELGTPRPKDPYPLPGLHLGEFINKMPLLTRSNGEAVDKVYPTAHWKGLIPVALGGIPLPGGDTEAKAGALLQVVKSYVRGPTHLREYVLELKANGKIRKSSEKAKNPTERAVPLSDIEKTIFGIGQKARLEKTLEGEPPTKAWDFTIEQRSAPPYLWHWIEHLQEASFVELENLSMGEAYNDLDREIHEKSRDIESTIGSTNTCLAEEVVRQYSKVMEATYNHYEGIEVLPLTIKTTETRLLHGFFIKGPCHPKRDNTNIPIIWFQLLQAKDEKLYRDLPSLTVFTTSLPGLVLGVTLHNLKLIEPRHLSGIKRNRITVAGYALDRALRIAERDGATEVNWAELKWDRAHIAYVRYLHAWLLVAALSSNPRQEGFMANMRRLLQQMLALAARRNVYRLRGATPEKKASDCVSKDPAVLYFAREYNLAVESLNASRGDDEALAVGTLNRYLRIFQREPNRLPRN
uniref:Putative polymerase PA subunit n=1 Tax=Barns Ness dog whelk orthomyxo-like virus 1 TaxID=2021949 RepID=A0A221LFL8_9ORTO|nr:putative polymerase PA subunit [Barns Ness dog whelk orthomyxo-like virus 1]